VIAALFPGQGSAGLLAGIALAASMERGRALLERAAEAADLPLTRITAHGGRALERTEVLQPVLVAVALSTFAALREASMAFVAGHSLGEIAAFSAAGCISPDDAVDIAALRGRLMAREAARRPGGLLAILDGSEAAVAAALARGRAAGWMEIAAWNAVDEVILAGDPAALAAAPAAAPSRRLPVAGAWHSAAMQGAVEELRAALRRAPRRPPSVAMVLNRDGLPASGPDEIPDQIAEQLTRPIHWTRTLATLSTAGVTDLVTIGPGKVLRGLARKALGSAVRVHGTEDTDDLRRTQEALAAPRTP